MENVCVKFEENFLWDIERTMKNHRYSTKTEFIRETVREKVNELKKEELLRRAARMRGVSKLKTTDEELHKARKRLAKRYGERFR